MYACNLWLHVCSSTPSQVWKKTPKKTCNKTKPSPSSNERAETSCFRRTAIRRQQPLTRLTFLHFLLRPQAAQTTVVFFGNWVKGRLAVHAAFLVSGRCEEKWGAGVGGSFQPYSTPGRCCCQLIHAETTQFSRTVLCRDGVFTVSLEAVGPLDLHKGVYINTYCISTFGTPHVRTWALLTAFAVLMTLIFFFRLGPQGRYSASCEKCGGCDRVGLAYRQLPAQTFHSGTKGFDPLVGFGVFFFVGDFCLKILV